MSDRMATTDMKLPSERSPISDFYDNIFSARNRREMRIVLAGKTGKGKSSLGNSILGTEDFTISGSASSETGRCEYGTREMNGRKLVVIDTPGLFDTNSNQEIVATEIGKAVGLSTPGPHAFLIVIRGGDRFTDEEEQTVKLLENIFSGDVLRFCIVIITHEEDIPENATAWIQKAPVSLQELIKSCGNRYMSINNKADRAVLDQKVLELMNLIDQMVKNNEGRVYTNEMYEKAEREYREREEEQIKTHQEQYEKIQQQINELEHAKEGVEEENNQLRQQLNAKKEEIILEAKQISSKTRDEGRSDVRKESGGVWNTIKPWIPTVVSGITSVLSAVIPAGRSFAATAAATAVNVGTGVLSGAPLRMPGPTAHHHYHS